MAESFKVSMSHEVAGWLFIPKAWYHFEVWGFTAAVGKLDIQL